MYIGLGVNWVRWSKNRVNWVIFMTLSGWICSHVNHQIKPSCDPASTVIAVVADTSGSGCLLCMDVVLALY